MAAAVARELDEVLTAYDDVVRCSHRTHLYVSVSIPVFTYDLTLFWRRTGGVALAEVRALGSAAGGACAEAGE